VSAYANKICNLLSRLLCLSPSAHGIRYPQFPLPENSRCTAFASRPSPEIGKQQHSRAKNVSLASDDSFDRKDIKSRRGEANEKSKEEGGSLRLRVKFKGRDRQFRCFSNPICVKSSVKGSSMESFIWRNQYIYIYIYHRNRIYIKNIDIVEMFFFCCELFYSAKVDLPSMEITRNLQF